MKKDCERTRKAFPRYLRGHVFRTERSRIERHLSTCVLCRSEYEGLKRADETRQILKDINASEGVVERLKDTGSTLSGLKKIFYRPLWIAAIVLAAGGIYYYAITPRQLDLEIDQIVKSEPATAPSAQPGEPKPTAETNVATTPSSSPHSAVTPTASAPPVTPLVVSITPNNEKAAIRRINEALRGHGKLRQVKLSETAREASGTLTAQELQAFFSRIEPVATAQLQPETPRLVSERPAHPVHAEAEGRAQDCRESFAVHKAGSGSRYDAGPRRSSTSAFACDRSHAVSRTVADRHR